jgi:hypothetical protein
MLPRAVFSMALICLSFPALAADIGRGPFGSEGPAVLSQVDLRSQFATGTTGGGGARESLAVILWDETKGAGRGIPRAPSPEPRPAPRPVNLQQR